MYTARKITANIPANLLKEAQTVTQAGVTATLVSGLELLKRRRAWQKFKNLQGKIKLEIDLEEARERTYR